MTGNWDPKAHAEEMKRSTDPVSAFFLIDSLEAIPGCIMWLALLMPYGMLDMAGSPYFNSVRDIYASNKNVRNFDYEFKLLWESHDYPGLLRCHFVDQGHYEIELIVPGIIVNAVADQLSDGHTGFFCAFMPPVFYD